MSVRAFLGKAVVVFLSITMVACVAETIKPEIGASKSGLDLKASLKAVSANVSPGESLEVMFTLENNGSDSVRILPWGTPLEAVLSADIFEVTYNDAVLPYRGRVVKRATPTDTDYVLIEAGDSLEALVNLSQAYDVRSSGIYSIGFKLANESGLYQINDHSISVGVVPEIVERL